MEKKNLVEEMSPDSLTLPLLCVAKLIKQLNNGTCSSSCCFSAKRKGKHSFIIYDLAKNESLFCIL